MAIHKNHYSSKPKMRPKPKPKPKPKGGKKK